MGMMLTTAAALVLLAPPGPDLTLIHGDEHLATWLDTGSIQSNDRRTRVRALRVRGTDQAFWLVYDVDCAAGTSGMVSVSNVEDGKGPPDLEGREPPLNAPRRYDRFRHALTAAVCDGARPYAWAQPVLDANAAIAAAGPSRDRAVAERPLELIRVVEDARFVRYLDRATLEGGGPQWEARTFQVTAEGFEVGGQPYIGGWSYWEFDCDQWRRQTDLLAFASVREDGTIGPRTKDDVPAEEPTRGSAEWPLWTLACAPDIWDRDVITSLDEAVREGREALAE